MACSTSMSPVSEACQCSATLARVRRSLSMVALLDVFQHLRPAVDDRAELGPSTGRSQWRSDQAWAVGQGCRVRAMAWPEPRQPAAVSRGGSRTEVDPGIGLALMSATGIPCRALTEPPVLGGAFGAFETFD